MPNQENTESANLKAEPDALADSWQPVAADFLRCSYNIPERAIPALVAKCSAAAGDWELLAREWYRKKQERADIRQLRKLGLFGMCIPQWPPLPIALLRQEIRDQLEDWTEQADEGLDVLVVTKAIVHLWDQARQVPDAPPPPSLTVNTSKPVRDVQEALGALDDLLRWCDAAQAAKPAEDNATRDPAAKNTNPESNGRGGGRKGGSWQGAQSYLEKCRSRGERFTTQEAMACLAGCSASTINKAIKMGSVELQDWAHKQTGESRLNLPPESSAVVINSQAQAREPDPSDVTEAADVEAATRYLVEQARRKGGDQMAADAERKIQAMDSAERRCLAEMIYDDPEKAEQAERRRRAKKKSAEPT